MVTKNKTTKKTKRKVAGRSSVKRKVPGWIILLCGMLFGLLIAVFGYVNGWVPKPNDPNDKPIAQSTQSKGKNIIEDKSADLQIKPNKDHFDFYDKLPGMEFAIDETDLKQTDSRSPINYLIQLGSFKSLKDAEALKAQVAFIGLTTMIESVIVNQTNWHRVRLGPYKSGRKVDVVKRNLEKNGFNALIIKQK